MQMRCKTMQIMAIQFQSKATFGNKSTAGLVMEKRVHQRGQHEGFRCLNVGSNSFFGKHTVSKKKK